MEYIYTDKQKKLLDLLDRYYYLAQAEQRYLDNQLEVPLRIGTESLRVYDAILEHCGVHPVTDPRRRHDGTSRRRYV